ncbi:tRNA (adenosine(37)-N6)-threonylcarbamoyltransferase complex ATPase subunit type 1 TsaE [Daejeonella sp. JGW-45]|uniref:tRNA (adenosine(37)-N6)-threonylcarbamoyltransferase complex ATPase subunit type 1 TsaE n=1 Tax=Daejeonella sp. JGW-45 TaxID=3034148 RepID=UPI0023EE1FB0|nr:tRNA (adenosine(37)-N6)-threonylcarbamoyltransferase complex ATPase subunit type 1 TsaE [Daejeonella sp. JGW-45]
MKIDVRDVDDLPAAAREVLAFANDEKIFLFNGEMGAGKTTFIKAICHEIGIADTVSSPTYSIINEYNYKYGKAFHFDFFRIKNEAEAYDIGFEEYLYSGNFCFIEWPEKIKSLWPPTYIEVVINQGEDLLRTISLKKV